MFTDLYSVLQRINASMVCSRRTSSRRSVSREGLVPKFQSSLLKYLLPCQWVPVFFPTFLVTSAKVRIPHVHTKPNRLDRRGAASLRYRNRAEITVLMCEQKPYPFDFRAASSVFVRKISTKKRLTNEKTKLPLNFLLKFTLKQRVQFISCESRLFFARVPIYIYIFFFFPWSNICGKV